MTTRSGPSRRDLFRLAAAGFAAFSSSGWIERLAAATADDPQRKRSCILLWMNGGPSTIDPWDLQSGHAHRGSRKGGAESVARPQNSEYFSPPGHEMGNIAQVL